jgi:K+-sensing histidine kinase KdpD
MIITNKWIYEQEASSREYAGLFIARSMVVAHGGTIWAENAEDGGAQFWVRLPASKEIGV